VPLDELRRQLEVNVVGQVAVLQALLPALRAARGRVVFVSSASGRVSLPVMTPYSASKHAIEAIADGLRGELRPWGIDVVLVEPGSVDTDIWRGADAELEATIGAMREEHRRLYAPLLESSRRFARENARRAAPVDGVTAAIVRAATAERPRTRYPVGQDAKAMLALRRLLPDRAFDALVRRATGAP
jgi:NAD(P)-dependent dehydrogenase (short-subunit alcohol dehydrogenase family)